MTASFFTAISFVIPKNFSRLAQIFGFTTKARRKRRLRKFCTRKLCPPAFPGRQAPHLRFAGRISDNQMLLSTLGRPAPYDPASRRVSSSRRASTPAVRRVVQCHLRVVIPNHHPFDWRSGKIRKVRQHDLTCKRKDSRAPYSLSRLRARPALAVFGH